MSTSAAALVAAALLAAARGASAQGTGPDPPGACAALLVLATALLALSAALHRGLRVVAATLMIASLVPPPATPTRLLPQQEPRWGHRRLRWGRRGVCRKHRRRSAAAANRWTAPRPCGGRPRARPTGRLR